MHSNNHDTVYLMRLGLKPDLHS